MASPSVRMNFAKTRFLVVEDNPQSAEIISQILLGIGVSANRKILSGAEARQAALVEPFDIILLDDDMPDLSGFDLAQEIRRAPNSANATTAIIMLSAYTPRLKVERARDSGVNLVVSKPVSPASLLRRIERLARERRPYVVCDTYCGPDRRFRNEPLPEGVEERRADAMRLLAAPERALSQDEINSLFD